MAPLWEALQARQEPATITELAEQIGAPPNSVQLRLLSWSRAGLLTVNFNGRKTYTMTEKSRALGTPPAINIEGKPKRDTKGRDRMWRAMRTLRRFDLPTLLITAEVSRSAAQEFINCLKRAGMVQIDERGHHTRYTWTTYAMTGRFGPKTPVVSHRETPEGRVREVFDPNTGKIHDISPRRPASFLIPGVNHGA